jgi:TamB, inner membrane protein subunit of TAM complex
VFIGLTIPSLEAKLPQEAARSLIELGDSKDIVIAQAIARPSSASDAEALPWRMRFDLGQRVKITRADLSLPISGSPEIVLGESLQIQGNVELRPGGRLSLPGVARPFTIESGTVSFDADGDPKNPRLKVRAVCKLPQLIVWATVSGTFQDAKFVFESDNPNLTNQAQILAALIAPTDSSSTAAAGANQSADQLRAGAGYLSQQLLANTALSHLELKAGNETTADQHSYATYSAAYPITDEIWFEGSYKTLQTQDLTGVSRNAFSGTFDWRFKRNWSLTVEAGTIGAGTDLLWLYRY